MVALNENRENLRKPLAAHVDYRRFLEPQIQGMNGDLIIERHKDFLFIEFKGPGETVSTGENIMLRALATKPGFEVLVYEYNEKNEGKLWFISAVGHLIL